METSKSLPRGLKKNLSDNIKKSIKSSPSAAVKALLLLYSFQTMDEKDKALTLHSNSVGFNAYDAAFLTDLARKVLSGVKLSSRQLQALQNSLIKYHRQLLPFAIKKWEVSKMEEKRVLEGKKISQSGFGISDRITFEARSSFEPTQEEVLDLQSSLGYPPQGYGSFRIRSEKEGDIYVTTWRCSASCD